MQELVFGLRLPRPVAWFSIWRGALTGELALAGSLDLVAEGVHSGGWLPVEDYFQTSHGLVIPADLIAIK
jgi:hypothetical protein